MSIGPYILLLPDVALEKIFSFLTFDEVAENREVCKKFNHIGGKLLTRGFIHIEKRHSTIYKRMKALLPRRESERRIHPLARHCDILSAVETRISMLNMTFSKYIENGLCYFIPGKVIDEIEKILCVVEMAVAPPRTHELLQELRDISSMAMEHFDENILPSLKTRIEQPSSSKISKFNVLTQCTLAKDVKDMKRHSKIQKMQISQMHSHMEKVNRRVKRACIRIKSQSIKLRDQERRLHEQSMKIQEQEATIADMRKQMDEWEQRFYDLTAELRAKDGCMTKAPMSESGYNQPTAKFHFPNIMPRKAQVLPKTFTIFQAELERKRKFCSPIELPAKLARVTPIKAPLQTVESQLQHIHVTTTGTQHNTNKIDNRGSLLKIKDEGTFLSSSIEGLMKKSLTSIKSRKRKITQDIDLN